MQETTTAANTAPPPSSSDDLLWRQLKTIPAFRALLRAVEARFYQVVDLPQPVLDVGCGDGHFAQMAFDKPLTAGTDPWWGPLQKAQNAGVYQYTLQSMGDHQPFPDGYFASAFSNSVLEHIPDVQAVLNETNRVLQPGGKLVITMPSHYFSKYLGGARFLESLGLNGTANQYRRFFNFISRHAHTDTPQVWAERLATAGFRIDRWQYYFSKEALQALEWGHVQGLPSAILHFLTGHWIVAPWRENLRRTEAWVRPFYEEAPPDKGAYILIIAHKAAGHAIEAALPPAQPFTIEALKRVDGERVSEEDPQVETGDRDDESEAAMETAVPPPLETFEPGTESLAATRPSSFQIGPALISGALIIFSLLFAIRGQSLLNRSGIVGSPNGLRWYGLSLFALLILALQRRTLRLSFPSLPRPGHIPRRRWLYLPALLLAILAQQQAGRPSLAFFLWFLAIATTLYALRPPRPRFSVPRSPLDIAIPIILFLTALIVRIVNLASHPFILNGTEASTGLDALNAANGLLSPFATGWLTNPTLPAYLMSVPLRLLGSSVLSIRLLSPLVGALTVTAVYWIGKRLWGREVGVAAAVLLTGSHFHLHYSRLGVTNVWDPLLVLLALGFTGIAWQQHQQGSDNRLAWLLAGAATGFSAYLFTASRLLPLMLLALGILAFFFNRQALRQQSRHILAAAALALVIALPQILYYNNHPAVFMERANGVGILDSQSGWLAQEAERTGLSRAELWRTQLWRALLVFNAGLDNSPSYRPMVPLLSFGPAIFFALGLGIAFLRLRHLRYSLLLVWVGITFVFAALLLENPPHSHRLVVATPALALLAALALVYLGRSFISGLQSEAQANRAGQWLLPLLLVIVSFFALSDMLFYFGRYREQHTFGDLNTEVADVMAEYLNSLDGEWTAYFYGPPRMYVGFPTIPFLVTGFRENANLFDVDTGATSLPPAPTPNRTYIFLPERIEELSPIEAQYPQGESRSFPGIYANPLFYAYEVQP